VPQTISSERGFSRWGTVFVPRGFSTRRLHKSAVKSPVKPKTRLSHPLTTTSEWLTNPTNQLSLIDSNQKPEINKLPPKVFIPDTLKSKASGMNTLRINVTAGLDLRLYS
jgi:hypothetical protein